MIGSDLTERNYNQRRNANEHDHERNHEAQAEV